MHHQNSYQAASEVFIFISETSQKTFEKLINIYMLFLVTGSTLWPKPNHRCFAWWGWQTILYKDISAELVDFTLFIQLLWVPYCGKRDCKNEWRNVWSVVNASQTLKTHCLADILLWYSTVQVHYLLLLLFNIDAK